MSSHAGLKVHRLSSYLFNTCTVAFKSSQINCGSARLWAPSPVSSRFISSSASVMGKKKRGGEPRPNPVKVEKSYATSGLVDVRVVGPGYSGTPRSFIVTMDNVRYLFNCGEGTQRIIAEHKMRITRVTDIFITRFTWENIGGLLGMCLSLRGNGVSTCGAHGPPEVGQFLKTNKGFAELRGIELIQHDLHKRQHKDPMMTVDYVPILPSETSDASEPESKRKCIRQPTDLAVSYILTPRSDSERKIIMEKVVAFGIKKGPMVGVLRSGKSVTLDDGTVVTPDQVTIPLARPKPFLVTDCPSLDYLDGIESSSQMQRLYDNSTENEQNKTFTILVVHLTPEEVFTSPRYIAWMKRFGEKTHHMVLNKCSGGVSLPRVHELQSQLNVLHPVIFPLLPQLINPLLYLPEPCDLSKTAHGWSNLRFWVQHNKEISNFYNDEPVRLDYKALQKDCLAVEDFKVEYENLRAKQKERPAASASDADYPEVLFLGTGASVPSKTRNVSAIWINADANSSILLDCGEDTCGQLERHYGLETPAMLKRLKAVFVSHLHADHHMGIMGLVEKRAKLTSDKLCVVAPTAIQIFYQYVNDNIMPMNDLIKLTTIESCRLRVSMKQTDLPPLSSPSEVAKLKEMSGFKDIVAVPVSHPQYAHAIVLTHADGWKLAYSGDCVPSENLIEAGQGVDLLIHEATMEDDLADLALEKHHSTMSQAINVGMKMNAKFTLLSHFSQRYAQIPMFSDSMSQKVGIAFDNMKVSLKHLDELPQLQPALVAMFRKEMVELMQRKYKRMLQKESTEDLADKPPLSKETEKQPLSKETEKTPLNKETLGKRPSEKWIPKT